MTDNINSPEETWKPIIYNDMYLVSDLGRVWSIRSGKVIKNCSWDGRYPQVTLWENGVGKTYYTHRLVAEHFLFKPVSLETLVVNHKNGDKWNNSASNLEWVTYSENLIHSYDTGMQKGNLPIAEKPSDLSIRERIAIRYFKDRASISIEDIEMAFNCTNGVIKRV